jgi:hypothetical protein
LPNQRADQNRGWWRKQSEPFRFRPPCGLSANRDQEGKAEEHEDAQDADHQTEDCEGKILSSNQANRAENKRHRGEEQKAQSAKD